MNSMGAVDFAPNEVSICQRCNSLFQNASAELSAYIAAVEQRFGRQAGASAGHHWVDLLEQSGSLDNNTRAELRKITILAARHLADLMT